MAPGQNKETAFGAITSPENIFNLKSLVLCNFYSQILLMGLAEY